MNLKSAFLILATLSLTPALHAADYVPDHCEIFIDKVQGQGGSHASRILNMYIKVLPSRLDGAIDEVGFYNTSTTTGSGGGSSSQKPWTLQKLQSFMGAQDYYSLSLMVGSDFGSTTYEGVFYVRTQAGTTYWFKVVNGQNFVFNRESVEWMQKLNGHTAPSYQFTLPYSADPSISFQTQKDPLSGYFNPERCF